MRVSYWLCCIVALIIIKFSLVRMCSTLSMLFASVSSFHTERINIFAKILRSEKAIAWSLLDTVEPR